MKPKARPATGWGWSSRCPASSIESGEEADPEDFRAALSSYASQQSFVVVQGEADLKRILDAPLEQWRVFHPSQRLYVEHDYHGPFRLLGGAGTGKDRGGHASRETSRCKTAEKR